jgi:uncharacterized repeat protein (TIGR02543 family)
MGGITLPTPVRSGYTFNGWYTQQTGGTEITENPYGTLVNTTLYAHWKNNTITSVNFNPTAYNRDFTATNNGWSSSGQGSSTDSTICLKWIGSNYTSYWIQFQNGYSL